VFELGQVRELGVTPAMVYRRARAGRLHRVYHGVYSLVPPPLLTREGRWMAAVLACGPGAVLSHRSAAALLELRQTSRGRIEVTVPARSHRQHPGIEVHRSTTMAAQDVTRVKNIPCTTVARTQLDLADVINRRGVERVFDQAEVMEVFDLRALDDQLQRNPKRKGVKVIRAVLSEHYIGSTLTWSWLEERFFTRLRAAGAPDPEANKWILLDDGEPAIRGDFVYSAQRVVIETDGYRVHGTRQAFERDRRRDQRLITHRWHPMRVTRRHLEHHLERTVGTALTLLGL
jgi:hypothetical protein